MNSELMRAKQMAPAFSGITPDPGQAQAHALIGIGEVLEQVLLELQLARQARENAGIRQARRGRAAG